MDTAHTVRAIAIKTSHPRRYLLEIAGLGRNRQDCIEAINRHHPDQTRQRTLGGIAQYLFDFSRHERRFNIGQGEDANGHAPHEVNIKELDGIQHTG